MSTLARKGFGLPLSNGIIKTILTVPHHHLVRVFQVRLPLLGIRIKPGFASSQRKLTYWLETCMQVVEHNWNFLDKPVHMAGPNPH